MCTRGTVWCVALSVIVGGVGGCIDRDVGQIELFGVQCDDMTLSRYLSDGSVTGEAPATLVSGWGDRVRSNDDVVTIQVHSAHLQNLPLTLTGSRDVILFAEVQENAAAGYDMEQNKPLTTVVFVGRNQKIPGLLNFQGSLAYGPTLFKGHPLKIKFTLMVLQKKRAEELSVIVGMIGSIAGTAAPQYAGVVSEVVNIVRAILRAQPDVAAFDFEGTFLSDTPAGLTAVIDPGAGVRAGPGATTGPVTEGPSLGVRCWDAKIPWLRYGFFALVETKGRYARGPSPGTEGVMTLDGGRILDSSKRPLATNYLVFSVTPGQLAEEDATLAAAAGINEDLLRALRRSPEEISQSLEEIQTHAAKLTEAIIEARAQAEARKLAQQAQAGCKTQAWFRDNFGRIWGGITQGLDGEAKIVADRVGGVTMDRWCQKNGWLDEGDGG